MSNCPDPFATEKTKEEGETFYRELDQAIHSVIGCTDYVIVMIPPVGAKVPDDILPMMSSVTDDRRLITTWALGVTQVAQNKPKDYAYTHPKED